MALFGGTKQTTRGRRSSRLVATGKRIKGTWIIESSLPPKPKRVRKSDAILVTENRRVRTLH